MLVGKHLLRNFLFRKVKQGGDLSQLIFKFTSEYIIRNIKENKEGLIQWVITVSGQC
jgi:hypothetical protein